jgi:hypothetical protein
VVELQFVQIFLPYSFRLIGPTKQGNIHPRCVKIGLRLNTHKILAAKKYWWQKILAATKYWLHQKNIGAYKILASTKYSGRQNDGVNKILALTK